MEDKEYLVLEFLSRFNNPISFDELEKGLKDYFDKSNSEPLLTYVNKLEGKGMLIDNYVKGIRLSDIGKNHVAQLNQKSEKIDYTEETIEEKTEYGPKITRFVYRTYWVMFAISIIALIVSLLSLAFLFLRRS